MASCIILTELDSEMRGVWRSALTRDRHLVYSFRSGQEAVLCAQTARANLVIMDGLPEAQGLPASQQIRELPAYAGIPIVVTTWDQTAGFKRQAQRAGVSKLLFKPFSRQGFLDQVYEFIERPESAEEPLLDLRQPFVWQRPPAPVWADSPKSPLGRSRQYLELMRRLEEV